MSETKQTVAEQQKKIDVTLIKAHTHAGEKCPVGAKIKVTEPERDWLAANGCIKSTTPKEASDK